MPNETFTTQIKEPDLRRMIREEALKTVQEYLRSNGFTGKKITDTPTDALSVVNRNYVNMSGTVANRPTSSVATIGQRYFATNTNIPMTFNGTNWVNGSGSVVALG